MTIFGKRVSEYVAFCWPILVLIFIVAVIRLALSLEGVSILKTRWISATVVIWIGVLYYAVRVHTSGFGSYKQLLPIYALETITLQIVIIPAIIWSIHTGELNAFTAPEVNFNSDGRNWYHVLAHIFFAPIAGSLSGWLGGSLVMLITKLVTKNRKTQPGLAR